MNSIILFISLASISIAYCTYNPIPIGSLIVSTTHTVSVMQPYELGGKDKLTIIFTALKNTTIIYTIFDSVERNLYVLYTNISSNISYIGQLLSMEKLSSTVYQLPVSFNTFDASLLTSFSSDSDNKRAFYTDQNGTVTMFSMSGTMRIILYNPPTITSPIRQVSYSPKFNRLFVITDTTFDSCTDLDRNAISCESAAARGERFRTIAFDPSSNAPYVYVIDERTGIYQVALHNNTYIPYAIRPINTMGSYKNRHLAIYQNTYFCSGSVEDSNYYSTLIIGKGSQTPRTVSFDVPIVALHLSSLNSKSVAEDEETCFHGITYHDYRIAVVLAAIFGTIMGIFMCFNALFCIDFFMTKRIITDLKKQIPHNLLEDRWNRLVNEKYAKLALELHRKKDDPPAKRTSSAAARKVLTSEHVQITNGDNTYQIPNPIPRISTYLRRKSESHLGRRRQSAENRTSSRSKERRSVALTKPMPKSIVPQVHIEDENQQQQQQRENVNHDDLVKNLYELAQVKSIMENPLDIVAKIQANLEQAIERKKPREQTIKFELDGQKRACCLVKPFTYLELLESIKSLFGSQVFSSLDSIRCVFSRGDALRLPIENDDDINKKDFSGPRITAAKTSNDDSISTSDDGHQADLDDGSIDSPPPGTVASYKRRTTTNTSTKSTTSNDGGLFIPELSDEIYSSGGSSIASRESSSSETSARKRLTAGQPLKRTGTGSTLSGSSALSSSSNSSHTSSSSSESCARQCSCSGYHYRSPQTPSNWKLGRQLGQGAFGKVFLCYDVDTGSELAIKQILIRGLDSETSREVKILECEINLFKQLNHERIVRYHGAARTSEYLQIFMEYMTGGSVREQILNYGALTEQLTRKYTRQIVDGLNYLHKNRFVHRDIKCANILRDISGNIKLGDFGTSRRLIAITNQNQPDSGTIGTAHWTAPEIIQGSIFGRKADIWSLGCTVVEMLTTGPPWQNLQPIAAIFHIATCDKPQYDLPENVSKHAREFIDACFTKDYHQRPTAEELFDHVFLADTHTHNNSHNQPSPNPTMNLTSISF
ncbi:unnamed protein product [Adineta ricciae]|uniref:Protein kinase domain-containing protein n=1 Tax=Adineta ricciae TaxID=249248 RepID=A0A814SC64_ADIRI|nr:unnamed protein product [Adineta ricciae]